ncbi:3-phytase A [Purpureocillium lavendulum]|uniref:3-phytase A n=1 Tax=Purpureocillium lavendulum TaxID=1247861 RepID=A0AB34G330_9HYPO|nr:3-phytase A [Purpureocillium lavendulum]
MKYSLAFLSALVAAVAAKPAFLNSAYEVTEGKPFTLKFSGCESGCTIVIQTGVSTNLKPVKTLTSGATGGSFTFTPEDLPSGTYNFKITDGQNESNYSPQFSYQGTGTTSAASTGSATASTTGKSTAASSTASASETESTATVSSTTGSTSTASNTTMSTQTTSKASSTTEASTTGSSTVASTTSSAPSATTTVPNAGGRLSSPMGLAAGAVAVMAFLN